MSGLWRGASGLWGGASGLSNGVGGLWGGASGLVAGGGGPPPPVGVPPSALYLDFVSNETLDPRLIIAGASGGTRVNAAGLIAPKTTPRYDYDPATLAPLGLLVEAQVVNAQIQSNDYTQAAWLKTDITITPAATTSPDGSSNGTLATEGSAGTALLINTQIAVTAAATYTVSRYFKYGNCQWVQLNFANPTFLSSGAVWFDIQNGVVGASQAVGTATQLLGRIANAGNGWWRCSLTVNLGSYTNAVTRSSSASGNLSLVPVSGATYYMYGSQHEAGIFATSYIPTVAAAVTRTADSVLMISTSFSAWYNPLAGSVVVEHDLGGLYSSNHTFAIDNATAANRIAAPRSLTGGGNFQVTNASASQCGTVTGNSALPSTISKLGVAWQANDFAMSLNGGAVVLDTAGTIPAVSQLRVGGINPVAAYLNGHVRRLAYWNTRLSNSDLQLATTTGWPPPPVTLLTVVGGFATITGSGLAATHVVGSDGAPAIAGAAASGKTTGKYYFEYVGTFGDPTSGGNAPGVMPVAGNVDNSLGVEANSAARYCDGSVWVNGANMAVGQGLYASGAVIGVAYDRDAGQIRWSINGGAFSASYAVPPSGAMMPAVCVSYSSDVATCRFTQASWAFAPPDGTYGPWTAP